jgi:hypothetical protein
MDETTSHHIHARNCLVCVFVRRLTTLCVLKPHDSADLHNVAYGKCTAMSKEPALLGTRTRRAAVALRKATAANRLVGFCRCIQILVAHN